MVAIQLGCVSCEPNSSILRERRQERQSGHRWVFISLDASVVTTFLLRQSPTEWNGNVLCKCEDECECRPMDMQCASEV